MRWIDSGWRIVLLRVVEDHIVYYITTLYSCLIYNNGLSQNGAVRRTLFLLHTYRVLYTNLICIRRIKYLTCAYCNNICTETYGFMAKKLPIYTCNNNRLFCIYVIIISEVAVTLVFNLWAHYRTRRRSICRTKKNLGPANIHLKRYTT